MHILLPMLKHIGVDMVGIAMYLQVIYMGLSDRNANQEAGRDKKGRAGCSFSRLQVPARRKYRESEEGRHISLYFQQVFTCSLPPRASPQQREADIIGSGDVCSYILFGFTCGVA